MEELIEIARVGLIALGVVVGLLLASSMTRRLFMIFILSIAFATRSSAEATLDDIVSVLQNIHANLDPTLSGDYLRATIWALEDWLEGGDYGSGPGIPGLYEELTTIRTAVETTIHDDLVTVGSEISSMRSENETYHGEILDQWSAISSRDETREVQLEAIRSAIEDIGSDVRVSLEGVTVDVGLPPVYPVVNPFHDGAYVPLLVTMDGSDLLGDDSSPEWSDPPLPDPETAIFTNDIVEEVNTNIFSESLGDYLKVTNATPDHFMLEETNTVLWRMWSPVRTILDGLGPTSAPVSVKWPMVFIDSSISGTLFTVSSTNLEIDVAATLAGISGVKAARKIFAFGIAAGFFWATYRAMRAAIAEPGGPEA